jgi:hypothetical protein
MPSEAAKYLEYARECIRLAGHAVEAGERDQLVELARTWMQAAMTEDEAAAASAEASLVKTSPDDPQPRV